MRTVPGPLLVVAAAALWGSIGLFVSALLARGWTPLEVAFWRALLAGALFAAHAGATRRWQVHPRRLPALAGFALVGITAFYAALPLAIAEGGVSLATVLLYTAPVFVVLLAPPLHREPLRWRRLALAALAVSGVALLALRGGGAGVRVSGAALGWGLLAGASYATHYLAGKPLFERVPPVTAFAWVLPLGALGLFPLARPRLPADAASGWLFAGLAVVCTWVPYSLYAAGLRACDASRAALVATLEPVVAIALATALLGERLDAAGIAGAGLVLLGAAGTALDEERPA